MVRVTVAPIYVTTVLVDNDIFLECMHSDAVPPKLLYAQSDRGCGTHLRHSGSEKHIVVWTSKVFLLDS